ncbi:Gustatory receptor for bitter taste 93a [Frankliniella fusca]|uniref:Gustatory receptor n=1 Tax=Frankliniella fusca TaxID=407009 RepID=A0AAE1LNN8_9NEOP|nr:Gustatory receptor for bitter taste 93a [Frankliniella fusca]
MVRHRRNVPYRPRLHIVSTDRFVTRGAQVATWLMCVLRILVMVSGARRRAVLAELVQCVRAYCARHPVTARGWRAVGATLLLLPVHAVLVAYFVTATISVAAVVPFWTKVRIVYAFTSVATETILAYVVVLLPVAVIGSLAGDLRADCELHVANANAARTWRTMRRVRPLEPVLLEPPPPSFKSVSRMLELWPVSSAHRRAAPPRDLWPIPPPPDGLRSPPTTATPAGLGGGEWATEKVVKAVAAADLWPMPTPLVAASAMPWTWLRARAFCSPEPPGPEPELRPEPLAWRSLRQRQQLLYDLSMATCAVFEWRLLCIVLTTLLYATLHLTSVVQALSYAGPVRIPLVPETVYVIVYLAYFVVLCCTYQWFSFESIKMARTMQNYLVSCLSIDLQDRKEIALFMEQISTQELQCSVLGLFDLDTETMITVISGVCSYVFVMLQFNVRLR